VVQFVFNGRALPPDFFTVDRGTVTVSIISDRCEQSVMVKLIDVKENV
jgi:hypothetical protein